MDNLQEYGVIALEFFSNYGHYIFLLCVFFFQIYQLSQPFPEIPGSPILSITSMKQLDDALAKLKKKEKASGVKQYVIVDVYATWCNPCRRAAPLYDNIARAYMEAPDDKGRISSKSNLVFAKCDGDVGKDVATKLGVKGYPTFKGLDVDGKEIFSMVGWKVTELSKFISENVKLEDKKVN
eukprot:snap_masked-scaffold_8-processed-gene-2.43-mRNA-1 protein AED:0.12 eAED:0.12 QI:0/-1/0/1/-1/1/1/0/180